MTVVNDHFSDNILVSRVRQNDKNAFKIIYDRYSKKIYGFSLKYLGSSIEAEELVQIVFINVWENRRSLDPDNSVKSYIYKAAINYIYNYLKKKKIHNRFVQTQTSGTEENSENLYEEIFFHDLEKSVESAVARLPEQQQRIFRLSRYDGLSYQEIAARLGLSVRTVENQVFRALKTLKTVLRGK